MDCVDKIKELCKVEEHDSPVFHSIIMKLSKEYGADTVSRAINFILHLEDDNG